MYIARFGWVCIVLTWQFVASDYTVTIHPEYLAQGGRTHFEADRWDGHTGLDNLAYISRSKQIGTKSGRWIHEDYRNLIFEKATEDPNRKGYPNPSYFSNPELREQIATKYYENVKGYGLDSDMMMELKSKNWPHWMNKSLHENTFPNNLDAAAEMVLYLVDAVNRSTNGHIPPYLEPINEPGGLWRTVHWTDIVEFHRAVAAKIKEVFPKMKVGGPSFAGGANKADERDFKIWKLFQQYLDVSFDHLDFFSFHPFNRVYTEGETHSWSGGNEARFVALLDLVESYSWKKKGKSYPIIPSAYGLGGTNVKITTPSDFHEWAFGFVHNAQMFTFLNHRGDIDRAVAFLLTKSHDFASASLFRNGAATHVAYAYQFWQHFNDNHLFLRVDSDFDGKERIISPLALANPHSKEINILLHSYQQTNTRVKMNFDKNWIHAPSAKSTCYFLNSNKTPMFTTDQPVTFTGNVFTIPAEASCYISIKSGHNFQAMRIVHEHTYYAREMIVPIKHKAVETTVHIPALGHVRFANLRVGISIGNKTAQTKPKTVHINHHSLKSSYTLFAPGKVHFETLWDVYVYQVPVHSIKQHSNTIGLEFATDGGYVSTVALVTGTLEGDSTIIG